MKVYADKLNHLYNRGNNKGPIFFEENNYRYFLDQFKKHVLPFCDVYAYCLMPNHFHFFVRINDEALFEKGIKNFFISYTKAINQRYDRVGSLFQGRYKVLEITSDIYYTVIIAYIHQNPVIARFVKRMEDYKYSSYNAYLSQKETMVSKNEVLEWFGGLDGFIDHHRLALDEAKIIKQLKI